MSIKQLTPNFWPWELFPTYIQVTSQHAPGQGWTKPPVLPHLVLFIIHGSSYHWMFQVFIYSLKLGAEIVLLSSPCPRLFTSYLHLLWFIMPHFYLFFIWKAIAPVGNKQLCYLTCPKLTQKICTLKPIQNSVNGKLNVFMPFYSLTYQV